MTETTTRAPGRMRKTLLGLVLGLAVVGGTLGVVAPDASAAPAAIAINSSRCPSPIKQGQYSGCVTDLQNRLNGILWVWQGSSWGKLDPDGSFGPITRDAVLTYQWSRNLAQVDALVGPNTKTALVNNWRAVSGRSGVMHQTPSGRWFWVSW